MRKRSTWLALLLILSLALGGCGAAQKEAPQFSGDSGGRGAVGVAPSAPAEQAPAEFPAGGPGGIGNAPGSPAGGSVAPVVDRKIIQNAEVELSVKDVDQALSTISDALKKVRGYVQDSRMSGTREQGRTVTMKVRVPAAGYDGMLDLLRGLGEVRSLHQWTNDVTEEYLDLAARIETGEAHLAQLNKLYERSGTVAEMIELEREIARVTAELESLKGRYNFLSNQVAFSTISITLHEPGVPAPSRNPQTLGERMRDAFLYSWNATVAAAENLLIWLVALIPSLLFLLVLGGIIGVLIWLIVRTAQGRRRPPAEGSGRSSPESGKAGAGPAAGPGSAASADQGGSDTDSGAE